jgi:hypothetical protein
MRIESITLIPISELKSGDCFQLHGETYMKCSSSEFKHEMASCLSVDIKTGVIKTLVFNVLVKPRLDITAKVD